MLAGTFGGAYDDLTPDEKFERGLDATRELPGFEDANWYTTISVSKEIDVALAGFADVSFAFAPDVFQMADEHASWAKDTLDLCATLAASIVDQRLLERVALEDRIFFFADGKRPAGVPVLTASADEAVVRGGESLANLERRLAVLARVKPSTAAQQPWLARTAHWRVAALLELDPWKRFLWAFVGLEILTNKLYERFRDEVIDRIRVEDAPTPPGSAALPLRDLVWSSERAPLVARFAVVAVALFPGSAGADVERFKKLKAARDQLSHGSLRTEEEVPAGEALALFGAYLDGALKRPLLEVPSGSPWEEAN